MPQPKMNAAIVCVDFADVLAMTLPHNRHHFDDVLVITSPTDGDTKSVAVGNDAHVYATDAFYRDGADFNKWLALEEGLDVLGREGWLCLLDADVLFPKEPAWNGPLVFGKLYSPLRRMCESIRPPLPPEEEWWQYHVHRNIFEWAGYCQIFHAKDPVLGPAPWHETDWRHAGGADSFFQKRWRISDKVRPPFEVLHIGPAGENWCGRVTPDAEGKTPEQAEYRRRRLEAYMRGRRTYSPDKFSHEKLKPK